MSSATRIALGTPIVAQVPVLTSAWETTATPVDLSLIASTAERLGYAYLTCSDHTAVPGVLDSALGVPRGQVFYDSLSTLSYLAGCTSRIRLLPYALVLGHRHPLEIVKQFGTLDVLSGGRLTLGVGVGDVREEFEVLGTPFGDRGRRADEALEVIRHVWGKNAPVSFRDGRYYTFENVIVNPSGSTLIPPIWVGGRSMASLRRAINYGECWMPVGLHPKQVRQMMAEVDLPPEFQLALPVLQVENGVPRPLDPKGTPEGTLELLEQHAQLGATTLCVSIGADSLEGYLDQLAALAQVAPHMFQTEETAGC